MGFEVKINKRLLTIKMHYFFFMAAMGPILPFISVYAKQLGVSSLVMGISTCFLPVFYFFSKLIFGFIADYFQTRRKTIFLGILISGSMAFVFLYFIPVSQIIPKTNVNKTLFTHPSTFCNEFQFCNFENSTMNCDEINYRAKINCHYISYDNIQNDYSINVALNNNENNFITPLCLIPMSEIEIRLTQRNNHSVCDKNDILKYNNISCEISDAYIVKNNLCLYQSYQFWFFIILMAIGSISFNVTNSISDAICFDILGEHGEMGYGRQRLWGTIGFGIGALLAGYAIDLYSRNDIIKSYTPTFILIIVFTLFDVICCKKLELPIIPRSKTITQDVLNSFKNRTTSIFLIYCMIVGIIDSFIIYFLFWYVEDLANQTNHMHQIKSIEGLIIAAETLGGEVIIFLFSGKILKKLGYGYTFALCFICYSLRLLLISLVPNPWWIILIELFMQGPTYALSYTIVVSMASAIAPPGASATMQGIAAGMDDGFGYAIGSLIGGVLYYKFNGVIALRVFSGLALIVGISYLLLYIKILKKNMPSTKHNKNDSIIWRSPEDAIRELETVDKNDISLN